MTYTVISAPIDSDRSTVTISTAVAVGVFIDVAIPNGEVGVVIDESAGITSSTQTISKLTQLRDLINENSDTISVQGDDEGLIFRGINTNPKYSNTMVNVADTTIVPLSAALSTDEVAVIASGDMDGTGLAYTAAIRAINTTLETFFK